MVPDVRYRLWFEIVSVLAVFAAGFHLAAGLFPDLDIGGSRWRHGLFVIIDLALSHFVRRRPVWFLPVFAILALQQLYSHGNSVISSWSRSHEPTWLSLGVCIVILLTLGMLIHERLTKS